MKKIYLCTFLVLMLSVYSCRKEHLTSDKLENEIRNGIKKDFIKLEKVNFELFLKELGTKSPLGLAEFNKGIKTLKEQVSYSTNSQNSIILETDNINKIKNQDHTTYTIPIKLPTKYATKFQNLIIDIEKGNTTSFLITYFPDKFYEQKIHQGKKPYFTGRMIRTPFNLVNSGITTQANNTNQLKTNGVVCTTLTYVSGIEEVPCNGDGHWVGEACNASVPAHYEYTYSTTLDCVYEGGGTGGGNGEGGGAPASPISDPNLSNDAGNTAIIYPSPPSNYEPCIAGSDSGGEDGINQGGSAANVCDPYTPIPYSNLTLSLQQVLSLDLEQTKLIDANPTIGLKIAELVNDNLISGGGITNELKLSIVGSINSILNFTAATANPANNITGETNDETTINFDNNNYAEYQQGDAWPTIKSVIPPEKFIKFDERNCFLLAKLQIGLLNLTVSGYSELGQTFKTKTAQFGVSPSQTKMSVTYLKEKLQAGIPVIAGVDYMPGSPRNSNGESANPDEMTDHFIVIVGTGKEADGRIFFNFFDSATKNLWDGTSSSNKLYYNANTGEIKGTTEVPFFSNIPLYRNSNKKVLYTVTQIRKTKSK